MLTSLGISGLYWYGCNYKDKQKRRAGEAILAAQSSEQESKEEIEGFLDVVDREVSLPLRVSDTLLFVFSLLFSYKQASHQFITM